MIRLPLASFLALAALTAAAQDTSPALRVPGGGPSFSELMASHAGEPAPPAPLLGRILVDTYYAPSGTYKIDVPVSMQLGGAITDTESLVVFDDSYLTHLTIANFPLDATQKWDLSISTPKEYLIGFFEKFVMRNYREAYKGVEVRVDERARFIPSMLGGAFIGYITIPGGTYFASRIFHLAPDAKPRVAKYGVLLFVHDGTIFIISMELAERATEGSAYHLTSEQEDSTLRGRLLDIASKIQFLSKPRSP